MFITDNSLAAQQLNYSYLDNSNNFSLITNNTNLLYLVDKLNDFNKDNPSQKDYYWLFLVSIAIWIFIGNFIVVLLILKYKQMFNNNTTKIILSLSVTDLCLSIFVLPIALYTQVNRSEWNLGYSTCLLWLGFDMQLTTTSIFHLVSISFERYLSIIRPMLFRKNMQYRISCLIALSWLLSFLLCTLPFMLLALIKKDFALRMNKNGRYECNYSSNVFLIYATTITFWLPLLLMIIFGLKTVYELHKKKALKKKIKSFKLLYDEPEYKATKNKKHLSTISDLTKSGDITKSNNRLTINGHPAVESRNSVELLSDHTKTHVYRKKSICTRKELQAQKTLVIVLIVFILSYFPLFTFFAINSICKDNCKFLSSLDNDTIAVYFNVFTWLGYSSSGINPCLYAYFNSNFKMGLQRLFSLKTGNQ